MGAVTPSGLRYPSIGDAPNVPSDMQNLATDLDKKVTPTFATTAARDAAITAPTQGQQCYITSYGTYEYDGSAWVTTGRRVLFNVTFSGSAVTSASTTAVAITGIGNVTFTTTRVRLLSVVCASQINGTVAGDLWRVQAGMNGVAFMTQQDCVDVPGGVGQQIVTSQSPPRAVGIGTQTALFQLQRIAGSGTVSYVAGSFYVIDEGPA